MRPVRSPSGPTVVVIVVSRFRLRAAGDAPARKGLRRLGVGQAGKTRRRVARWPTTSSSISRIAGAAAAEPAKRAAPRARPRRGRCRPRSRRDARPWRCCAAVAASLERFRRVRRGARQQTRQGAGGVRRAQILASATLAKLYLKASGLFELDQDKPSERYATSARRAGREPGSRRAQNAKSDPAGRSSVWRSPRAAPEECLLLRRVGALAGRSGLPVLRLLVWALRSSLVLVEVGRAAYLGAGFAGRARLPAFLSAWVLRLALLPWSCPRTSARRHRAGVPSPAGVLPPWRLGSALTSARDRRGGLRDGRSAGLREHGDRRDDCSQNGFGLHRVIS